MNEQVKDEEKLEDWFDEPEELLADDNEVIDEETSPPNLDEDTPPNEEVLESDDDASLEEGTPAKPAQSDDPYAWIEQLDPEVKAQAEALAHKDRSNSGRVAALQSRLDKLSAEQEAQQRVVQESRSKPAANLEEEVDDMSDAELAEFMEEFPSVATNVKKLIEQRIAKEREEILGEVRPLKQEAEQHRVAEQRNALRKNAELIFDYDRTGITLEEVLGSPAWSDWFESLPPGYKKFAQGATDAEDATKVLEDFAAYAERTVGKPEANAESEDSSDDTPSKADKIAARRKAAQESDTPPSRSAEMRDTGGGTYDDYFNEAVSGS